jgi:threonine/homoserine/homoserine lactone efflux protein
VSAWEHALPAFGLGFALGAAPGPVQVLILSQTARRGLSGGLRVMLGANGMLLVVMLALAIGFSAFRPTEPVLDWLRVLGGIFLVWLGAQELRTVLRERAAEPIPRASGDRMGPTAFGVVSVILNPGAWIFFATTASAVVADATADGGRDAAVIAALATAVGVSASDLSFTVIGSGGKRLVGDQGLLWIRGTLSVLLAGIGVAFVVQGLT